MITRRSAAIMRKIPPNFTGIRSFCETTSFQLGYCCRILLQCHLMLHSLSQRPILSPRQFSARFYHGKYKTCRVPIIKSNETCFPENRVRASECEYGQISSRLTRQIRTKTKRLQNWDDVDIVVVMGFWCPVYLYLFLSVCHHARTHISCVTCTILAGTALLARAHTVSRDYGRFYEELVVFQHIGH